MARDEGANARMQGCGIGRATFLRIGTRSANTPVFMNPSTRPRGMHVHSLDPPEGSATWQRANKFSDVCLFPSGKAIFPLPRERTSAREAAYKNVYNHAEISRAEEETGSTRGNANFHADKLS